jgi:hypothetical protein
MARGLGESGDGEQKGKGLVPSPPCGLKDPPVLGQ